MNLTRRAGAGVVRLPFVDFRLVTSLPSSTTHVEMPWLVAKAHDCTWIAWPGNERRKAGGRLEGGATKKRKADPSRSGARDDNSGTSEDRVWEKPHPTFFNAQASLALGRRVRHPAKSPKGGTSPRQKARGNGVPKASHAVTLKHWFIANDRYVLCLSLGNEHTVERVLVRAGQEPGANTVLGGNAE